MPETGKTLTELGATINGSGWPHGDKVAQEILDRCQQSEAIRVITELEEHIKTMGINSNYRVDRFARQSISNNPNVPEKAFIDMIHGAGEKLSEKGHKRFSLLIKLQKIREQIAHDFNELAILRTLIEAANMEMDGTHVPAPSEEERLRENIYHPTQEQTQNITK